MITHSNILDLKLAGLALSLAVGSRIADRLRRRGLSAAFRCRFGLRGALGVSGWLLAVSLWNYGR